MEKTTFLRSVFFMLIYSNQLVSSEFAVNGSSYFNITGTIHIRVKNSQDILDRESDVYKYIARNLTRGFSSFFAGSRQSWLEYTVHVVEIFLWPDNLKNHNSTDKVKFAFLARNNFRTNSKDKGRAEKLVANGLWHHVNRMKDQEGYIKREGLKVKYEKCHKLPAEMVHNLTYGYMAFITNLRKSGEGYKPTKISSGNSSAQESFNSSFTKSISNHHPVISYIAYTGMTLSMIGLFITMTSICYFKRLRKYRRNQILVHICANIMLGMLFSIMSFTFKGDDRYCTALALLLHYFILASLSWMCIEAHNLYIDLVKVFNTNVLSGRVFTIRACLFGYGLPAVIVSITSLVDINVYGEANDACWMTSLAFLISFLAPVLLIVSVNVVFFSLIMREIIQVSQRDANNIRPSLRAAISLSVVLGFCWLLAGISTFVTNQFVTYAFVIMSSFQGLFIFIFHGVGKQELRDSWKSLPIFNWQSSKFSNDSHGKGKTESTTQATPQACKRLSTNLDGKLMDNFGAPSNAGITQTFTIH